MGGDLTDHLVTFTSIEAASQFFSIIQYNIGIHSTYLPYPYKHTHTNLILVNIFGSPGESNPGPQP